MTRFNILLSEGIDMVLNAIENTLGGEVFVPKIPSYKITDVAEAIGPACEQKVVGIRPGEKLHEQMITKSDAPMTVAIGDLFAILPNSYNYTIDEYISQTGAKRVPSGFDYSSDQNDEWLTVDDIRKLIKKHMDPSFSV